MTNLTQKKMYRGRLVPTPTGYLHLGHARTFWMAQERARAKRYYARHRAQILAKRRAQRAARKAARQACSH